MDSNAALKQDYTIFSDNTKSFDLPTYTMVPPCLFNYTYYLYLDDNFIEKVNLGDENTIIDTSKELYMDPFVTN